ncbi:MAG: glycosyltransferase [Candidatus Omnitrophica bacterium]|nr:glycosyltransferase [Candidatus Omnitrophota bacterium]
MTHPAISVLMSVADPPDHIEGTINSVLEQTFGDIEFLIILDGVSGRTRDTLSRYTDGRLRVVQNKTNLGLTVSLNRGLDKARGKYIARIDCGDICLPDRLKKQYDYLESDPETVLLGGNCIYINPNGKDLFSSSLPTSWRSLQRILPARNVMIHPAVMFRRSPSPRYREKFVYSQDYDLYLRLLSSGRKLMNLPDPLIRYRFSPAGVSLSKKNIQMSFARIAREFYFQRMDKENDGYDALDPASVLASSSRKMPIEARLREKLEWAFITGDNPRLRSLYREYTGRKRTPDRYLLYYLSSFLPLSFIMYLRKTVSRVKELFYLF